MDSWSFTNLRAEQGKDALANFRRAYPKLASTRYAPDTLDLDEALAGADLVLVHEWNDPALVKRLGEHRRANPAYHLLFHDTHHRSVTDTASMAAYDLRHYDGVLAFGNVVRDLYLQKGWAKRAWTWHEAADTRVFHPIGGVEKEGDLVWIGNWGDEERTAELHEFLLKPVKRLGLKARVYGVRYPDHALRALEEAGIDYGGWLPNYDAPQVFARYRVTVHVPRGPYVQALPGIPTIRPFEALACGIPLISAPWNDAENLFSPGDDFLMVPNGEAMTRALERVLSDTAFAARLAEHGRQTILARHTCAHRVDELLAIAAEI
jgi:spore maturation protein CgeB